MGAGAFRGPQVLSKWTETRALTLSQTGSQGEWAWTVHFLRVGLNFVVFCFFPPRAQRRPAVVFFFFFKSRRVPWQSPRRLLPPSRDILVQAVSVASRGRFLLACVGAGPGREGPGCGPALPWVEGSLITSPTPPAAGSVSHARRAPPPRGWWWLGREVVSLVLCRWRCPPYPPPIRAHGRLKLGDRLAAMAGPIWGWGSGMGRGGLLWWPREFFLGRGWVGCGFKANLT